MLLTGAACLEKNKQAIDAMNVFPVPDGDTGTNMSMTMMSAAGELQKLGAESAEKVAATAASRHDMVIMADRLFSTQ